MQTQSGAQDQVLIDMTDHYYFYSLTLSGHGHPLTVNDLFPTMVYPECVVDVPNDAMISFRSLYPSYPFVRLIMHHPLGKSSSLPLFITYNPSSLTHSPQNPNPSPPAPALHPTYSSPHSAPARAQTHTPQHYSRTPHPQRPPSSAAQH